MIDPVFLTSPLYSCDALGGQLGCTVSIKLETANPVRSFKGRGAELVASHLADQGAAALVCASAGNLGQALGWSGRRRGLDVTVVARRLAPAVKLDRIRSLGAHLELVDGDFEVARERAVTIGLELVDAVSPGDAVLITLGRGAGRRTLSGSGRRRRPGGP